jgi:hypothetical protein
MLRLSTPALMIWFLCALVSPVAAQEVTVSTVYSGLRNPLGVAIRPEGTAQRHEVFVSESGAGRIVKVPSSEPGKAIDVVTGFEAMERARANLRPCQPTGLIFLTRDRLAVALENAPSESGVLLYELPDEGPLPAERSEQKVGVAGRGGQTGGSPPANFYSFARTTANDRVADLLIATTYGQDGKDQGLLKMPVRAGTLSAASRLADVKQSSLPSAVAISRQGFVVVASWANVAEGPSSRLAFFNPISGEKVMELALDMENVRGLAYHPGSGNLYAADYGKSDSDAAPEKSGIYRIDDAGMPGELACRIVKIAGVPRPTALAFAPGGALYVTAAGMANDGGSLVKLVGEL